MKLNRFEFVLMNNPLRAWIQQVYELPTLLRMAAVEQPQRVLEVGCGSGNGSRLIRAVCRPRQIAAIDLDERMIRLAMRRHAGGEAAFQVMDAAALAFGDQTFDAVFDFGIMHHIVNWRDAVAEIKRVLVPGGRLIMEDLSIESFSGFPGRLYRPLMIHPYQQMYTVDEFTAHVSACGLRITHLRRTNPLGLVRFFYLAATA